MCVSLHTGTVQIKMEEEQVEQLSMDLEQDDEHTSVNTEETARDSKHILIYYTVGLLVVIMN